MQQVNELNFESSNMYNVYVIAVSGKGDDRSAHFRVIHAGRKGLSKIPISMCK